MGKIKVKKIAELSNTKIIVLYRFLPKLNHQLNKVNKKLIKKGISPITIDIGDPYWDEILVDNPQAMYGHSRINVQKVELKIHHEIPILKEKGFAFVGAVSFKKDVKTIFNNTKDLTFFDREIDFLQCDHCNSRRYRNTISFFRLLKNQKGHKKGDLIQIGSTCSKDYFGLDLIRAISAGCEFIHSLNENLDGFYRSKGNWWQSEYEFERTCVASYITLNNDKRYISNNNEGLSNSTPTSAHVCHLLDIKNKEGRKEVRKLIESKKWIEFYKELMNYWQNEKEVKTDFDSNVKERFVNYNIQSDALIACGVWELIKDQFKPKDCVKNINDYIGEIGETFTDHITVIREIPFNGYYGPGIIIQMLTDDGYTLKWFTSYTKKSEPLILDAKKTISYEIKDHNEYNGYKSTIIKVKKIVNLGEKIDKSKKKKKLINPFDGMAVPTGRKWTKDKIQTVVKENENAINWILVDTYNRQTENEKISEHTTDFNGVGFSGLDGEFGSSLATAVIKFGDLSEGQKPFGLKLALKYSGQFAKVLNKRLGL